MIKTGLINITDDFYFILNNTDSNDKWVGLNNLKTNIE